MDPVNIRAKFEVRSSTRSWDNRVYWKKIGQSLDTPTLPFLPNFSKPFGRINTVNTHAKFEVRSFARSWDNRGCWKNLGRPWIRPHSLFSQIFDGLLLGCTVRIYLPNLKLVALRVPEIIGVLDKLHDDVTSDVTKPGSTIRVDDLYALCISLLCYNMV